MVGNGVPDRHTACAYSRRLLRYTVADVILSAQQKFRPEDLIKEGAQGKYWERR